MLMGCAPLPPAAIRLQAMFILLATFLWSKILIFEDGRRAFAQIANLDWSGTEDLNTKVNSQRQGGTLRDFPLQGLLTTVFL